MTSNKTEQPMTQQEFLRHAMATLDMTREEFSKRLGMQNQRKLDSWLLPVGSEQYRSMPDIAWTLVREILENHRLKNI